MCLSVFLYDVHPKLLLLLAFNRDEFFLRPTAPSHFWEQHPQLLAGRDLLRGGTWLGFTTQGRFSFLTNFREAGAVLPGAAAAPAQQQQQQQQRQQRQDAAPLTPAGSTSLTSRGELPVEFLVGRQPPLEYLKGVLPDHGGFNLVVGDLAAGQVAYWSNRGDAPPQLLPSGSYGVSNGLLQQWPKVDYSRAALQRLLLDTAWDGQELPWDRVFGVMSNTSKVQDPDALPLTGVGRDIDHYLSSAFIEENDALVRGQPYGTRSQTVVAVWRDGRLQLRERYLQQDADEQWRWRSLQQDARLDPEAVRGVQLQASRAERQQPAGDAAAQGAGSCSSYMAG